MKFLVHFPKVLYIFFLYILFANITVASMNFDSKMNVFENYLKSQKTNIQKICSMYGICDKQKIKDISTETDELLVAIKQLRNTQHKKDTQEIAVKIISNKIQEIRKNTKKYVKREIEISEKNTQKQQKIYNKISKKLELSLKKIIRNIYKKQIKNTKNIAFQRELTNTLLELKDDVNGLGKFRNTKARNTSSMKKNFLNILLSIKRNILDLQRKLK